MEKKKKTCFLVSYLYTISLSLKYAKPEEEILCV
jgi:hypothetical protein